MDSNSNRSHHMVHNQLKIIQTNLEDSSNRLLNNKHLEDSNLPHNNKLSVDSSLQPHNRINNLVPFNLLLHSNRHQEMCLTAASLIYQTLVVRKYKLTMLLLEMR